MADDSSGKQTRWSALCDVLGLDRNCDRGLRYQLVHRTASAVIEATRFHARKAALVVHSFSPQQDGFGDFQAFVRQLGGEVAAPGQLVQLQAGPGVHLFAGWAQG
jgi:hypothetical protein